MHCVWKNRTDIITNDNAVQDNKRIGDNDERNRFMDYCSDILEKHELASYNACYNARLACR